MSVFGNITLKSKLPESLWSLGLFLLPVGFAYKTATLKDSSKAPA